MKQIRVECPAKINISLKILDKREDGFHNIESVMQSINLFDYLKITCEGCEGFFIDLSGDSPEIPYDERNLVYKAILKFVEVANITDKKISVYIEKNIPVSAGLAGGSTDSAGVVYGLNKIFDDILTLKQLHQICSELGSDLNFCLVGGRQLTTSRGEVLSALEFEEFPLSLMKPISLGISAGEAYTKFAKRNSNADCGREKFVNDLEWAVIEDYEILGEIKQKYPNSVMSGSGSTFFVVGEEFLHQDGFWVRNNLKSIPFGVRICN
ncbi:MAG: 4-(cytidine 5'-diphospho)-2-C-methyl-D-erythritol kinase [Candidatus Gastranaerophilales bacterium]